MTCSTALSHIDRGVLKSPIYLCYRVQPCVKEEGKCKMHHHRYNRDLLCDSDGLMHMRTRTISFFRFTGERKLRQRACVGRKENSSLLLSRPVLLPRTVQSHQHPTANKAFMPTHALVQRHHTSWTRGESLWHSHSVTASADTS